MKELENNIIDLFRSYHLSIENKNFENLVWRNKIEYLNPIQLQKFFYENYNIDLKNKDAEELEIMILAYCYAMNYAVG